METNSKYYSPVKPIVHPRIQKFITEFDFNLLQTPANILFPDVLVENISLFKRAFKQSGMQANVFFSCKSNKSKTLLSVASQENCGIEVSSIYELQDALKYTKKIIASGPAKSQAYLECAAYNKAIISVDDISELRCLVEIGKSVDVLLRISDILNTRSRFGINQSQLKECHNIIANSKIQFLGYSFHINNYDMSQRIMAIREILEISRILDVYPRFIDIGGGFPVRYCNEADFENFIRANNQSMYLFGHIFESFYPYWSQFEGADAVKYILNECKSDLGYTEIIVEPGRSLLSNCGITIFDVMYMKSTPGGDNIVIVNGNINSLSEQWFGSEYLLEPLLITDQSADDSFLTSIAGNLCLEQDVLTWRKVRLGAVPRKGDKLIYFNTAGYQMDSNECNFCKFPVPPKYIILSDGECVLEGE